MSGADALEHLVEGAGDLRESGDALIDDGFSLVHGLNCAVGALLDNGDFAINFFGEAGGSFGQGADFLRDDGKTLAVYASAGSFNAGVEGEEVGLPGDVFNDADDLADAFGFFAEGGDGLGGAHDGIADAGHGVVCLFDDFLAGFCAFYCGVGIVAGALGVFCDFLDGGIHFGEGGGELADVALFFVSGGGDLMGVGFDLDAGAGDLCGGGGDVAKSVGHGVLHGVDGVDGGGEFVGAGGTAVGDGEVFLGHGFDEGDGDVDVALDGTGEGPGDSGEK